MFIIEYTTTSGRDPPQVVERQEVEGERLGSAEDVARLTFDRVKRRFKDTQLDGYQIRDDSWPNRIELAGLVLIHRGLE